jgi:hypothetical protein
VAGAQGLFERRMQFFRAGVGAFFQVAREQVFVFLDDLVDQGAVRHGDRFKIALAAVVAEQLNDVLAVMRRQVEQHALAAEGFADLADQLGAGRRCRRRSC